MENNFFPMRMHLMGKRSFFYFIYVLLAQSWPGINTNKVLRFTSSMLSVDFSCPSSLLVPIFKTYFDAKMGAGTVTQTLLLKNIPPGLYCRILSVNFNKPSDGDWRPYFSSREPDIVSVAVEYASVISY
jgi:hypothetical protein